MDVRAVIADFQKHLQGQVSKDAPLSHFSTWKIGGTADVLVSPACVEDVSFLQRYAHDKSIPCIVIGDGSNMLFDDDGFRGIVIHIGRALSRFEMTADGVVHAEAGIWTPHFVRKVACAGFKGSEHAIGVPGTLGGLVVMNGGTNRKGIGEQITSVTIVKEDGKVKIIEKTACDFSYRHSSLQDGNAVVVGAAFKYEKGDASALRLQMITTLMNRNRKFPRKMPNCGSVFLSSPELHEKVGPPGKVVQEAGFKGFRQGGAMVSDMHANFIVNTGGATSDDVLTLITKIRAAVFERTGHKMECEARHLLPNGKMVPAHEICAI